MGREFRALQLERLEFAVDRLVERGRRLAARLAKAPAPQLRYAGLGLHGRCLQRLELVLAGVDQRDVGIVLARQRRKFIDRHVVFAARRAQREQPLLDALQFGRVEIGGAQGCFKMAAGLLQRGQRGVERLHRRLDQARRLRRSPLQPADDARQRRHAGIGAGDHLVGVAQVLRHLLRLHHGGAPLGERGLLAGLRRKLVELFDGVAQPVALALGALDLGAMGIGRSLRLAPRLPERLDLCRLLFEPAEGVEQPAVSGGIDQSALVVLAVDLDQRTAELLEHLHAHRLIVDESARASVGELHAAQDQFVLGGNIIGREQRARRMVARDIEHSGHLALLDALPHQRLVAAAAQSQRESIEQDRLAGAGLAGEHGKAVGKIDVEPVDQDDVADRKSGEHWPGCVQGLVPGFAIIKDADGRHKAVRADRYTVNQSDRGAQPRPMPLNALLIQEPWFSFGSTPPVFTSA